jgi:glucose/arabinose dehydrogenase
MTVSVHRMRSVARRLLGLLFSLVLVTVAFGSGHAQAQTCSPSLTFLPIAGAPSPVVTDIRHAGDARQFFVEQVGRIRVRQSGQSGPFPVFLDLTGVVAAGGERGLLSAAFHPSYPAVPWFFVLYTSQAVGGASNGDVRLARYNVSVDPNLADPASARVLLTISHAQFANHNGGQLQFGPDGFLYVSVGDGGSSCDVAGSGCNGQRNNTLLGKLLRIDINRDSAPYYNIPATNPFIGAGDPLDEIWAKGLRNPFRFSFDSANGTLWLTDVGQNTREEINVQAPGAPGGRNYGWKIMEGTACNTCATSNCPLPMAACNDSSLTLPFHEYDTSVGRSITGGYVYRGSAIPALVGCYVFGDYVSGAIWAIDPALPALRRTLHASLGSPTTFGVDNEGELYVGTLDGVFKLTVPPAAVSASTPWSAGAMAVLLLLVATVAGGVRRSWQRAVTRA